MIKQHFEWVYDGGTCPVVIYLENGKLVKATWTDKSRMKKAEFAELLSYWESVQS